MFTIDANTIFCYRPNATVNETNQIKLGGEEDIVINDDQYSQYGPLSTDDDYYVYPTSIKFLNQFNFWKTVNAINIFPDFTLELFVKFKNLGGSIISPIGIQYNPNNIWSVGWELRSGFNRLFQQYNANTYYENINLSLDEWHHIAFQGWWVSATNQHMINYYVNGEKIGEQNITTPDSIGDYLFYFGGFNRNSEIRSLFFNNARIDKFALHKVKRYDENFSIEENKIRYQQIV